jgi:hypothetical protein
LKEYLHTVLLAENSNFKIDEFTITLKKLRRELLANSSLSNTNTDDAVDSIRIIF